MPSDIFTPPRTKSNAQRKACICNWGDACCSLKTFFDKQPDHPLGGIYVDATYRNTCNFHNFLRAASNFLKISKQTLQKLEEEYGEHKKDPSKPPPRIRIAKHHFPIDLVKSKPRWLTPLTQDKMNSLESYKNRSPPPNQDSLLIYNPDLGGGQSDRSKKANSNSRLFRVAPFVTLKEVTNIAAAIQNQNAASSSARVDMDAIRRAYDQEQLRQKQLKESETAKLRSPEEWTALVDVSNSRLNGKDTIIDELESQIESLKRKAEEQEEAYKQLHREWERQRKKARRSQSSCDEEANTEQMQQIVESTWNKINGLIARVGGISRLTMFNSEWHSLHPGAARLLWGYKNWEETKLYVKAYFPQLDTNYDPSKLIQESAKDAYRLPDINDFEQCMICRLFFHTFSHQQLVALMIDKDRTRIGQMLKIWAPRWANVGMDLSCLDITANYLSKEVPDRNVDLGKDKLVFVDGKDYLCAPKRNDTTVEKCQFSSKNEKTAARDLTWSTATGLVFEFSQLFGGRGGERQIVEHMGSLGPKNAPINEWKDVASSDTQADTDDSFWTALSDVMTAEEFEEALQKMADGSPLVSNGILDDGILITGQATGLAREGLSEAVANESEADDSDSEDNTFNAESAKNVFSIEQAFDVYKCMVQQHLVNEQQRSEGSSKRPPILTKEILDKQNKRALINDPNQSGKRKLRQLERLQRLHILYESGQLDKCLLSYFLLVTEDSRLKLLRWMGSHMANHIQMPTLEDLDPLPLRLAKIPEEFGVGADKGFSGIESYLPNCNDADTPPGVVNSKKERLSKEQIEAEIPITAVRGGTETVFKRVMAEEILREKNPYWLIQWLPYGHALAHGEANLCKPLRYPGRNAIIGADYWTNAKEYRHITQITQPTQDIATSRRRECRKCKQGGIVQICSVCMKWFHANTCHSFENCNPGRVHNPYN